MTALWLALRCVRSGFAAGGRWALASNVHLMIVLAALVGAWGWWGWHRNALCERQLVKANRIIAAMRSAAEQAALDQARVNHAPAETSRHIAEDSNAKSPEYYAQVARAGTAYAAAHPVGLRCPSGGSAPGLADLPGADRAAPIDDRSGQAAGMVALSAADFDLLNANSARLAQVRQDAQALIAAGVAAPSDSAPR
ncbi:hypothetical protein SAMN05518801_10746 [Novosphingobium sp. CF614]|uniref:hypothetical protein n=1 Tax=Novosphingobium sp. CF614 TaxID=1884364 RepID=UPI0008E5D037|nr:hypothetical protein [Novosphingobium sp. CF614]SFG08604.1 hypothetical protein SAMN05518801_10746 [Novosphingobium sp. CF614]